MWIHLTDFLEVPALCSSTMALAYIPYQPKLILSSSSKLLQPAALISIPKQNGHLLAYDTKNPVFFLLYFWVNNSFQLPVFPKQQPCFGGVCHKLYTILLHSGAQNFFAVKPGQKKKTTHISGLQVLKSLPMKASNTAQYPFLFCHPSLALYCLTLCTGCKCVLHKWSCSEIRTPGVLTTDNRSYILVN